MQKSNWIISVGVKTKIFELPPPRERSYLWKGYLSHLSHPFPQSADLESQEVASMDATIDDIETGHRHAHRWLTGQLVYMPGSTEQNGVRAKQTLVA